MLCKCCLTSFCHRGIRSVCWETRVQTSEYSAWIKILSIYIPGTKCHHINMSSCETSQSNSAKTTFSILSFYLSLSFFLSFFLSLSFFLFLSLFLAYFFLPLFRPIYFSLFLPPLLFFLSCSFHGRLARWIKWRACDVGEAKKRVGEWTLLWL